MSPLLTFFLGILLLALFGWYFATDFGLRKRLIATALVVQLEADRPLTKNNLEQAVEVIRKRVDYFGGGEPVISPVGTDRILVQIPGLDPAKIVEARDQLSKVAKLEFRLVYPDNGERLRAIDAGTEVIPPEYRIETYKLHPLPGKPAAEERILVKKKADLGGDRVSSSHAYYGN